MMGFCAVGDRPKVFGAEGIDFPGEKILPGRESVSSEEILVPGKCRPECAPQ